MEISFVVDKSSLNWEPLRESANVGKVKHLQFFLAMTHHKHFLETKEV